VVGCAACLTGWFPCLLAGSPGRTRRDRRKPSNRTRSTDSRSIESIDDCTDDGFLGSRLYPGARGHGGSGLGPAKWGFPTSLTTSNGTSGASRSIDKLLLAGRGASCVVVSKFLATRTPFASSSSSLISLLAGGKQQPHTPGSAFVGKQAMKCSLFVHVAPVGSQQKLNKQGENAENRPAAIKKPSSSSQRQREQERPHTTQEATKKAPHAAGRTQPLAPRSTTQLTRSDDDSQPTYLTVVMMDGRWRCSVFSFLFSHRQFLCISSSSSARMPFLSLFRGSSTLLASACSTSSLTRLDSQKES